MTTLYKTRCHTPLGPLNIFASEKALHALAFDGQKYFREPAAHESGVTEVAQKTESWLYQYFAGLRPAFPAITLEPLSPVSAHALAVWDFIRSIPYGQTRTYGQAARQLNECMRTSPRAVGQATARNQFIILIPCHRMVGARHPGGFAGGLDKKQFLLAHELG